MRRAGECKECAARNLEMAREQRDDKILMLEALRRNTEAITRLVDAVRAMGGNGKLEANAQQSGVGRQRTDR